MSDPLLVVDDLSVSFPGRSGVTHAVRHASFTLGRERLGIVGESGSGKSTTGRALLGLVPRQILEDVGFDELAFAHVRSLTLAH